jgi:hypothetical protein
MLPFKLFFIFVISFIVFSLLREIGGMAFCDRTIELLGMFQLCAIVDKIWTFVSGEKKEFENEKS